ncbi:MAG: prohibitin family protein [Deltaproteobacteria bacterium]|nr:prohibitin family protein [Deltaproteobacteria bacterium]
MKFKQNVLRIVSAGLLIIGATGCTQVNAGNLGVVTKWGEIQDVALQEGIHFRTPVKTQIINISTRVHKMEASATASSKDLQVVSTRIALNYRVDAAQIVEVFRNVGTRLVVENTIIDPALQESLKQATAQYTAEELITRRPELSITDFQFDAQYQQAVESKQVAEQRALTARNDLARIKVEAEQAEAKALGVAKAMLARAEAEAKAQELLRKTISAEIVYLRAVEKWDGKQPTIVGEGGAILDLGAIKKAAGR